MKYLILAICIGVFGCATTKALTRTNRAIIIENCLTDVASMETRFSIATSLKDREDVEKETMFTPSCRHYNNTVEYQLSTAKLMGIVNRASNEVLSQEEFKFIKDAFDAEYKRNAELKERLLIIRNSLLDQGEKGSWE